MLFISVIAFHRNYHAQYLFIWCNSLTVFHELWWDEHMQCRAWLHVFLGPVFDLMFDSGPIWMYYCYVFHVDLVLGPGFDFACWNNWCVNGVFDISRMKHVYMLWCLFCWSCSWSWLWFCMLEPVCVWIVFLIYHEWNMFMLWCLFCWSCSWSWLWFFMLEPLCVCVNGVFVISWMKHVYMLWCLFFCFVLCGSRNLWYGMWHFVLHTFYIFNNFLQYFLNCHAMRYLWYLLGCVFKAMCRLVVRILLTRCHR